MVNLDEFYLINAPSPDFLRFAPNPIAFSLHFVPFGAHNRAYAETSLHFGFPNCSPGGRNFLGCLKIPPLGSQLRISPMLKSIMTTGHEIRIFIYQHSTCLMLWQIIVLLNMVNLL